MKKASGGRSDRDFSGDQIDLPKTADKLAKEHGVSPATVKRRQGIKLSPSKKQCRPTCSAEFRERNFALTYNDVAGPNGATRKEPAYNLTRDGFSFLAMGFTGKEAAHKRKPGRLGRVCLYSFSHTHMRSQWRVKSLKSYPQCIVLQLFLRFILWKMVMHSK